eukprot:COSAG05_NODE_6875_length_889_cov_1.316456_1_plen_58_part_10
MVAAWTAVLVSSDAVSKGEALTVGEGFAVAGGCAGRGGIGGGGDGFANLAASMSQHVL